MNVSDQSGGAGDVQEQRSKADTDPVPVKGRADIPKNAPPGREYRVEVVVQSVTERYTKNGKPCFFLKVRDTHDVLFFVVAWDWQWAKLRGKVSVGNPVVLDMRPPLAGASAFTLA